jgi:hypothetical protein
VSDAVEYLIIRDLQTTLRAIAVSAGYHFDVSSVAVKLDPNQDVESIIAPNGARPLMIVEVNPEKFEYHPASQVVIVMKPRIHWINDSDPTVDESFVQTYFNGCADIERAVAKRPNRGGYATDTTIVGREYDTLGAQVWAKVDLNIRVDRTFGAPDA